jgi:hypothetical protein
MAGCYGNENYGYMNNSELLEKLTHSTLWRYLRAVTVIYYVIRFDVDRKFHDFIS